MSLRCVEKVESTEFGNILDVGYNGEVKDTQILALKVKWRPHRQRERRRRCEERNEFSCGCVLHLFGHVEW